MINLRETWETQRNWGIKWRTYTKAREARKFGMNMWETTRDKSMQAERRIGCELEEKHLKKRKTLRVWKLWMGLSQLKLKCNGSQTVKSVDDAN